jgi:hypothetical protein
MYMTAPIIEWDAPEHYHYERSPDWYWAVGIIACTGTALAFIFGNVIFGILIIVATTTVFLFSKNTPRILHYEINDRGVVIHDTLYPFLTLDSFWIDTLHPEPKILLKSHKFFMPYISVIIEDVDPEDVRSVLLNYIAETEHIEPFTQKLLERLGM